MFFFRTDSSIFIGAGHVMRCLTLAEKLRDKGADVCFISRQHDGNLNGLIQKKDFTLYELPKRDVTRIENTSKNEYATWLGLPQGDDAHETINILNDNQPDWLIVDHYALDQAWEQMVRPYVKKIMVIDDLANRKHDCDVLLDQNYARNLQQRYTNLVPPFCTTLLGPQYALLRKEFAEVRARLKPRDGSIKRLFVFFGGVDADNMTGKVLEVLSAEEFSYLYVDVVIGKTNPHRDIITYLVNQRNRTTLHVQVKNIAELMAQADLALCAGGTTTWERFCLGLPSLVITIADNQVPFTRDLHDAELLRWLGNSKDVDVFIIRKALLTALHDSERNCQEAEKGMCIVNGKGVQKVAKMLTTVN